MHTIDKENIKDLQFTPNDVLTNEYDKKVRKYTAEKASILGNTEKSKVEILFSSNQGQYKVNTTIWHVGDDYIMLKSATAIPLRSIHSISL